MDQTIRVRWSVVVATTVGVNLATIGCGGWNFWKLMAKDALAAAVALAGAFLFFAFLRASRRSG